MLYINGEKTLFRLVSSTKFVLTVMCCKKLLSMRTTFSIYFDFKFTLPKTGKEFNCYNNNNLKCKRAKKAADEP